MGQSPSEPKFLLGTCGIQGRRPTMEDALCIFETFGDSPVFATQAFFGIFDGHNGSRCAEFLATELPKNLLKDSHFIHHPELALSAAFKKTNQQWFQEEHSRQDGSCAVTVLLRNENIYVANTGDSRAILSQGEEVIALSRDHKPTDQEEAERVLKLGGKIIGGRVDAVLAVSRAFGDLDFRERITCEPDVKLWAIQDDTEFIVMACDGVWDVATNEEVSTFVRKMLITGHHPETAAEALVQHCFSKRSLDNITVIIISFLTKERRKLIEANKIRRLEVGGPEPVPFVKETSTIKQAPLRAKDVPTAPPYRRPKRAKNISITPP